MDPLRIEVLQTAVGYWLSKALHCAAKADVADRLEAGPRHVDELARAAGVHPESLFRILRALASVGIFAETDPGVFALTPKAQYLRTKHPASVRHFAEMIADDLFDAWVDIDHAVATGASAVSRRFGQDFFARIADDPRKVRVFDQAMQEIHGGETELMLAAYDFARHAKVLDVGGGNGSTLAGILQAHPQLVGAVFDLPQVVANAREQLTAVPGFAGRVEFHAGDFFQRVDGRADCLVLRHVLHDWDDARCVTILENCRAALEPGGRILIVEKVLQPGNQPEFVKLLDLNMMAIGGKERSRAQYEALLSACGLHLVEAHTTPGPVDVIEVSA